MALINPAAAVWFNPAPYRLTLASASPRRCELLQRLVPDFDVAVPHLRESLRPDLPIEAALEELALHKAQAVRQQPGPAAACPPDTAANPPRLIIAADTVVLAAGEVLGKPRDLSAAGLMLQKLSGRTHQVITAVCLDRGSETCCFHEISQVSFYQLTETDIQTYLACGESLDKAGAYGIQGQGALLVREIQGDYYNIVGLPVSALLRQLRAFTA
ncbi:MAG: Maf family protein [Oscillospiraceae bacterium]|nr:Maf family protein [Oscillospiraceae bacterium]MDD4368755.1 Maf family protein [Oscillospiraceae bacterium]